VVAQRAGLSAQSWGSTGGEGGVDGGKVGEICDTPDGANTRTASRENHRHFANACLGRPIHSGGRRPVAVGGADYP
jgi:hypothetical protein